MKSVMAHSFSQVPAANIQRSTFDRSHGHKSTFNAGDIVPVFMDEGLPGDTFKMNPTIFARMATPIYPIMDNLFLDLHFFEVPIRLVWDNWKKFNGEQTNPGDSTDFTIPQMTSPVGGYLEQSLEDYMGLPTKVAGVSHSCLFHRAYNLIWSEWYRDQNLQNSPALNKGDGPDVPGDYKILKRGKRHDYFTSCLPWPQKGDSVSIPLGQASNIMTDNNDPANPVQVRVGGTPSGLDGNVIETVAGGTINAQSSLYADLQGATAATINQLRQAFAIQKMLERDARGGTRYTEIVRSHFGVTSPDSRQQRPTYLGGGSTAVNIHQVPQTESTNQATTPQGNLASYATAAISGGGFTKSFTEHVIIIGVVSARADLTYQQGMNRMFNRRTRYDHYFPALAHIGEQAVANKEIYTDGTAFDENVFGYQERFGEMRYKPSIITGRFRSNAQAPLHAWHLSQSFGSLPALNETFITENPPMDRVIAVNTEPHFIFDSHFNLRCTRPMPLFGVPGMIDRF